MNEFQIIMCLFSSSTKSGYHTVSMIGHLFKYSRLSRVKDALNLLEHYVTL